MRAFRRSLAAASLAAALLTTLPQTAFAAPPLLRHQVALQLDGAATAWVLVSTALVLLMTIPGLALFYGGMVRRKNVLATLTQAAASVVVVSILWFLLGYSIAFGKGATPLIDQVAGGVQAAFLNGAGPGTAYAGAKGLPEFCWIAYQMTFAIIAPALIAGAFAERMKFSGFLLFAALWHLLVYAPAAHWVWGGGFLAAQGVLDFAGGAVVHLNTGVAGLVCALVLKPRRGFGRENMAPHNLVLTFIGGALLWVGWIGFNAGSALAANSIAALALFNTLLAAAAGAVGWTVIEWIERKKPTLLGILTGSVAGLVAVTPAAGYVGPAGAFAIGVLAGLACYAAAVWLKRRLGYDDSLDAFGVHGVGGMVGAVLTGVFASAAMNPAAAGASVLKQALGVLVVIAWSGVGTLIVLGICKVTTGLRVTPEEERGGLDLALHGEALHEAF